MKKYVIYFLIVIFIFGVIMVKSLNIFAVEEISIMADRDNIRKGEEFEILVNLKEAQISSFQIVMYFDKDKLEYIHGPDDANLTDNSIIYTWKDETGGDNSIQEGEIARFRFEPKEIGEVEFGMNGTFIDENGNTITPEIKGIIINILEVDEEEPNEEENAINIKEDEAYETESETDIDEENEENENEEDSNTYLQTMRLGVEGISPKFDKNITEYTVVVSDNVEKLDLEAVPEVLGTEVKISGNTILKEGLNVVKIAVTSENGKEKREYIINITKTKDKKKANANLETFAAEYYMLEPLFDPNITEYKVEVSEGTNKVNILAIPENSKAKVSISDNGQLEYGSNIRTATVIAENGITNKKYKLNLYRRNKEEEMKFEKEQEENSEKLNEIIKKQELERLSSGQQEQNEVSNTNTKVILAIIAISGTGALIIGYLKWS